MAGLNCRVGYATVYMYNYGLRVCNNKIIAPFCVVLYFDDLKFFGKTKI